MTTTIVCTDTQEMVVKVLAGTGHEWMGSPDNPDPVWASQEVWDFFASHPT